MIKLMTQALDALRKLPDAQQDDVARFPLEHRLTAEDAAAIAQAEAELSRGERVAPQAIRTFWHNHGL
jgi:hypothetical protein